jgi:hypothetical protein|tara:strand:+ start:740 stop:1345 length:606 start_codon:yes stop_codon:yes gene_type:complete
MSKVITTPKGKAVWPRIDTADTKFDEDGVYSCKLHVTEGDFKAFEAIVKPKLDAAYKEECSRQGKDKIRMAASSPLRINDEGDHEIYAKQKAKVHTKSKGTLEFTIAAVDSQGKKIAMPKIGSGSILKMAVEVNTWFVPSQGFGYTLRLRAVQVLDLVEYGGGGDGSFGFGAEADGYVGSGESLNEAFAVADEAETSNAPF